MDHPPAVAFTAFADVWPRATGNGDRRRPCAIGAGGTLINAFRLTKFFRINIYMHSKVSAK